MPFLAGTGIPTLLGTTAAQTILSGLGGGGSSSQPNTQQGLFNMDPAVMRQMQQFSSNLAFDNAGRAIHFDHTMAGPQARNALEQSRLSLFGGPGAGGEPGLVDQAGKLVVPLAHQNALGNQISRNFDVADVERLGGRFRDQFRAANPELYGQIDQQGQPDGLNQLITDQVSNDLGSIGFFDDRFGNRLNRMEGIQEGAFGQVERGGMFAQGLRGDRQKFRDVQQGALNDVNRGGQFAGQLGAERSQFQGLQQSAIDDVARGGRLSEQELRDTQQFSRAADESRGILRSGMSIGNEILNTDRQRKQNLAFADQRLGNMNSLVAGNENRTRADRGFSDQRLAFGENLVTRTEDRTRADVGFADSRLGQSNDLIGSTIGQGMGIRNNFINNASQISGQNFARGQTNIANRQATFIDPVNAVLGRPGGVPTTAGGLFGQSNFNSGQQPGFLDDANSMFAAMNNMGAANALFNSGLANSRSAGSNSFWGQMANSGIFNDILGAFTGGGGGGWSAGGSPGYGGGIGGGLNFP
jgi:hypothetical protein